MKAFLLVLVLLSAGLAHADWYCEIIGHEHVNATGYSRYAALQNMRSTCTTSQCFYLIDSGQTRCNGYGGGNGGGNSGGTVYCEIIGHEHVNATGYNYQSAIANMRSTCTTSECFYLIDSGQTRCY
jgi:hypothetical protein